jgi:hypothetical protein
MPVIKLIAGTRYINVGVKVGSVPVEHTLDNTCATCRPRSPTNTPTTTFTASGMLVKCTSTSRAATKAKPSCGKFNEIGVISEGCAGCGRFRARLQTFECVPGVITATPKKCERVPCHEKLRIVSTDDGRRLQSTLQLPQTPVAHLRTLRASRSQRLKDDTGPDLTQVGSATRTPMAKIRTALYRIRPGVRPVENNRYCMEALPDRATIQA